MLNIKDGTEHDYNPEEMKQKCSVTKLHAIDKGILEIFL